MPTPIKRQDEKRSRSVPSSGEPKLGEMQPVTIPSVPGAWCNRAKRWYNSLKKSGQSRYYQQSDWELAQFCGDLITYVYAQKFAKCTMMILEINSMMARLGTTEGDRRQTMRVELSEPVVEEMSEHDENIEFYQDMMINAGIAPQGS